MKKTHKKEVQIIEIEEEEVVQVALEEQSVQEMMLTDALDYAIMNEHMKIQKSRLEILRESLINFIRKNGLKKKKNLVYKTDKVDLILERREKASFNAFNAERILKERGIFDQCHSTVVVTEFDEEAIEEAFRAGALSAEDIDLMFDKQIVEALKVSVSEEHFPEYKLIKELRKNQ